MRLYNTATRAVEPFTVRDNTVSMYVCGVTPYDTTHVGHGFTYVSFDTLARHLAHKGHDVRYVQNVTDIDDDILKRAARDSVAWDALGREQTTVYLCDMAALNVTTPELYVRATTEIPAMVTMARALLRRDLAYERGGSVYYRVAADPAFGRTLTRLSYEEMLVTANANGNHPDDPNKEDPLDFVLWQAAKPGEPSWESPWGLGRPGWHIECSALSLNYLGEQIDIHGGGSDLIFPHHSCEIAQSEPYTGVVPFARYWVHTAMVRQDGEKMSKSLGNMTFVRDVLRAHHPDALRLYLLDHHYREVWEYRKEGPATMDAPAAQLREAVGVESGGRGPALDVSRQRERFFNALDDDLWTPDAVASSHEVAAAILQAAADGGAIGDAQATLREMGGVLGLWLDTSPARL
jgi:L-cysteine:1D-myo-inositol 2-amino-2-deoxy-alpha-D-glucopyranoside ligase